MPLLYSLKFLFFCFLDKLAKENAEELVLWHNGLNAASGPLAFPVGTTLSPVAVLLSIQLPDK